MELKLLGMKPMVKMTLPAMIIVVFLLAHVLTADRFPCDSDSEVIGGSLLSYSWTCDNVIQCVDGSDEAGCGSCSSDRLLLKGIPHDDERCWLNGLYSRETYKIYNKAVWQSTIGQSYIYHNGSVWVMGSNVGEKRPLLYSDSVWATLFGPQGTWRTVSTAIVSAEIVCVTSSVRHCFGSLSLVSINNRNMELTLQSERSVNRPVYSAADNTTLRYVVYSDDWDIPHWQVAQTTNGPIEEVVVFLDTALHPGYITTPGIELYNDQWYRGSNVHLKCSDQVEEGARKDVDCVFNEDVCQWDVYTGSKFQMSNGPAETSSKSERVPSTLYVVADKHLKPGKFRITSPYIDVSTDSCVVFTIALSGNLLGSDNVTLTRFSLVDADEVMWSSDQITTHDVSGELNYTTVYTDLVTGASTKLRFEVVLGDNGQISGVVSLKEIAVFDTSCQEVDFLSEQDLCYDYPCGSGDCIQTGLKTFICSCPTTTIGDRCETDLSCPSVNITHSTATTVNNILLVECQEGYVLRGDLAVCGEHGWSELPTCEVKMCEVIEHSEVTGGNGSVTVSCDEGYRMVGEEGLSCELGEWNVAVPKCLKSCPVSPPATIVNTMTISIRKCSESYDADGINGHQICSIKNTTTNKDGVSDSFYSHADITSLITISVSSTSGHSDADTLCVDRHDGTECVRTCSYMTALRIWLGEGQFLELGTNFVSQGKVNSGVGFSFSTVLFVGLVFIEVF